MSSATSWKNHTRLEYLSTSTCCSLIVMTTMVRTSVASWAFPICFQIVLNLLPVFNTKKSNQRRPLPSREFIPPSCWISCNRAVQFHCSVCTLHKKLFGLWHLHWRRCRHRLSWIYLRCFHSLCFWPLSNVSFKPQFLPGFQLLRW